MKKTNQGFTLIELLAVILILGIIALIAIPTVTKVIDESREGAFKTTVQNVVNAAETKCQRQQLSNSGDITTTYDFSDNESIKQLDVKGTLPTSGTITLDNNCKTTNLSATNGKYVANLTDNKITIEKGNNIEDANDIEYVWKYVDDDKNGNINTGDIIKFGTESFYIISNDGTNIEALSEFNLYVSGGYEPSWVDYNENATGLQNSTMRGKVTSSTERRGVTPFSSDEQKGANYSDYTGSIVETYVNQYKTKLIEMGTEVSSVSLITKTQLDSLGCDSSSNTCSSAPKWVKTTSYWTKTAENAVDVWYVNSSGSFNSIDFFSASSFGVRPVITIKTSILNN